MEPHREFCSLCSDLVSQEIVPAVRPIQKRSIKRVIACFDFDVKLVQKSVHALKYKSIPSPSCELLSNRLSQIELDRYDYIVPIPLHWRRKNWRGYNQAHLLATIVSEKIDAPLIEPLKRSHYTKTQTKRNRWQRKRAMKQVFAFKKRFGDTLSGTNILLVDDVCTTGATAYSCGEILQNAGTTNIDLLTLAQA